MICYTNLKISTDYIVNIKMIYKIKKNPNLKIRNCKFIEVLNVKVCSLVLNTLNTLNTLFGSCKISSELCF